MVLKAVKDISRRSAYFVPEELALTTALENAWLLVYKDLREKVEEFVDFKNHQALAPITAQVFESIDTSKFWEKVEPKATKYIKAAYEKAQGYQPGEVKKLDESLRDLTVEKIRSQLQWFSTNSTWRLMAPDVMRLVDWMYLNPEAKTADLATITERIDRTLQNRSYFQALGSAYASRAFQFGSIDYFQETGIDKYQILSVLDSRICKVCVRMHGRVFPVSHIAEQKDRFLNWTGPPEDAESSCFPFPQLIQIDNQSPATIKASNFTLPPWHGRCRCLIVAFSKSGEVLPTAKPQEVNAVELTYAQERTIEYAARQSIWTEEAFEEIRVLLPKFSDENIMELASRIEADLEIGMRRKLRQGSNSYQDLFDNGEIKNQFVLGAEGKTPTSSGSLCPFKGKDRDTWERTISGGNLHSSSTYANIQYGDTLPLEIARERPLYGYFRDPIYETGVDQYGKVNLVMKPEVKARTTFSLGNSSGLYSDDVVGDIGTVRENFGIVKQWADQASRNVGVDIGLDDAMKFINENGLVGISRKWDYTEAQIYGGVKLDRDVSRIEIMVFKQYRDTLLADPVEMKAFKRLHQHIYELGKKWNIPVEIGVE